MSIKNQDENGESDSVEIIPDSEVDDGPAKEKIQKLKDDLRRCESERKEYLEGWQRAKADHINYKNDEGKRFEDLARFVISGLISDILPVLDSFDLALSHGVSSETQKGILLIRSQLEGVLKKRGVENIKVNTGDEFRPEIHESVGETESDLPDNKVAEEIQKGYTFQGKMIRPARVKISKSRVQ